MRYITHQLEVLVGIGIFPLISLCTFFLFFVALLVYVLRMRKSYVETMEWLPFEGELKNSENSVES